MPSSHTLHLRGVTWSGPLPPLVTVDGDSVTIRGLTRDAAVRLAVFATDLGGKATIINPVTVSASPDCTVTFGTDPLPEPPAHARTVETEMGTMMYWEVRDGR